MIKKSRSIQRTLIATATLALLSPGCAVDPKTGAQSVAGIKISEDPCAKTGAAMGAVLGGVAGALLTSQMTKNDGTRLLGAVGGAAIGGMIGNDIDNRRCEMFKIAKKYDQNIVATSLTVPTLASSPSSSPETAAGLLVVVKDTTRQFAFGSDQLNPNSRAFFLEMAEQYSYQKQLAKLPNNAGKDARANVELLKTKRILLIGHTDDTGNSRDNAALAERRAATVARLFRDQGIPETQVFYQGAGETFPIGDNNTEEGRSANRRVEIVEMADEGSFKKYLESRKPDYNFYRPAQAPQQPPSRAAVATTTQTAPTRAATPAPVASTSPAHTNSKAGASAPARAPQTRMESAAQTTRLASQKPAIDFGGTPYSAVQATIKMTASTQEKSGGGLISKAYADNAAILLDCSRDHPRTAGTVKSIRDGSVYKTSEHLPQLFGKTWAGTVNTHLVVLNRVAILRDGGTPANLPELKVYSHYEPSSSKKPDVSEEPEVNSYLVDQGVLYRMFSRGDAGLKCMDVLFRTDGAKTAHDGKMIYTANKANFVADFRPQQAQ